MEEDKAAEAAEAAATEAAQAAQAAHEEEEGDWHLAILRGIDGATALPNFDSSDEETDEEDVAESQGLF